MKTDGIEEAIEGQIRVLVTAAGQLAERIARAREEALRRAQARSEQAGREMRSRFEAEQRAARAELANVHRSDWWERATPEMIGREWQVARAWSQEDPEAARAEQRMADELRTRYGVDVNNTAADPEAVRAAVERAGQTLAQADELRVRSSSENAEAQRLVDQANQEDQRADEARAEAEHETDPDEQARAQAEAVQSETLADQAREDSHVAYDSSERRQETAQDLEAQGIDQDVVATRMRADVSQAKPATEAVKTKRGRSPKARRMRGSRGRGIKRDLSR